MISEKELLNSKYKNQIKYFVSNRDFEDLFINPKIIKYAALDQYNSIYEILSEPIDFFIILLENEKNIGHWQAMTRNHNIFTFYDSYGDDPSYALKFATKSMNEFLGNDINEDMNKILKSIKKKDKLIINKYKFQSLTEDVNTCGRWCAFYIMCSLNGLTIKEFIKLIQTKQKLYNLASDELICKIVDLEK
jgi:hypothetical protein